MLTRRPCLSKRTLPSVNAYNDQSRPVPTLAPATNRAPRCRMMMLPAVTCSPPNAFTPRRLLTLSRPLRLLPCPFLCAMAGTPELLCDDFFDFQHRVVRANATLAVIAFAAAELEGDDFLALFVGINDLGGDARAGHGRFADLDVVAVGDEQHFFQRDVLALLAVEQFDLEQVAGLDAVLFAAGSDDRGHD